MWESQKETMCKINSDQKPMMTIIFCNVGVFRLAKKK